MSKLTIVRRALETNPKSIIVNVDERNHLPGREGYFNHTVDYWVAPRNGLYSVDELQGFMIGLVPNLEVNSMDEFEQGENWDNLRFGKLYFDEKIGKEKITRICTLTDDELLEVSGFVDGQRAIEETDLERRIWVRPFPDEAFAREILSDNLRRKELERRYMDGENLLDLEKDERFKRTLPKSSEYWANLKELERYKPQPPKRGLPLSLVA